MTIYYTANLYLNNDEIAKARGYEDACQRNLDILLNFQRKLTRNDTLYVLENSITEDTVDYYSNWLKLLPTKNIFIVIDSKSQVKYANELKLRYSIMDWLLPITITDEAFKELIEVNLANDSIMEYSDVSVSLRSDNTYGQNGITHFCLDDTLTTVETLLSNAYGDHANPYTGYIERKQEYLQNKTMSFKNNKSVKAPTYNYENDTLVMDLTK